MSDSALHVALENEVDSLVNLHNALESEHAALLANDPQKLEDATRDKDACLNAQINATQARDKLLPNSELSESTETQHTNQQRELVQQLHALAQQCQHINMSNGALITRKQQLTRITVDALRQQEPIPTTYSDAGNANTGHNSRSLGSV